MKKTLFALVLVMVLIFSFTSCATTAAPTEVKAVANDGKWWNNPPADTADIHYEVGVGFGSTVQTKRDSAKASANTNLAQYINNSIDAIVTMYTNDAGSGDNMQAVQAFESLSKQRATAILTGVTYEYGTDDDGTVYALAKLPIGPVADELKKNVSEAFVKNEAAAEANNMMNDAIKKYFGTN